MDTNTNGKLTNLLLAMIAACLCLIVLHVYGIDATARAQTEIEANKPPRVEVTNEPLSVEVGNVPLPVELVAREPLRVQLYYDAGGIWRPVTLDAGALVVRPR
jgi:hypothetical protein